LLSGQLLVTKIGWIIFAYVISKHLQLRRNNSINENLSEKEWLTIF
jgi:hypothetical protein